MGTTYQPPNMAYNHSYHHASVPSYTSGLPNVDRKREPYVDSHPPLSTLPRHVSTQNQVHPMLIPHQHQAPPHNRHHVQPTLPLLQTSQAQPVSRHSTRPSTPTSTGARSTRSVRSEHGTSRRDSAMVLHSLEIPKCISPRGGNLADFAAQMTCFFWFESSQTHHAAEKIQTLSPTRRIPKLHQNAVAQPGFKKWVHGILATTQVTQNVILLALLFIHRLKAANPNVKGRPGSECRLWTVALMLSNKFLDDNTYTNKTWADVSHISVKEIHTMEVEFLSNMRYSLLVSKVQWEEWLQKLAKFWEYCERALMPAASPLLIPSPLTQGISSPLPSPTGHLQLAPPVQAYVPTPVAYSSNSPTNHGATWQQPMYSGTSPLAAKTNMNDFGKRHRPDLDATEPPAKRMVARSGAPMPAAVSLQPQQPQQHPGSENRLPAIPASDAPRVSGPQLTLNTGVHGPLHSPSQLQYPPATYAGDAQALPPLIPGVRAMTTVFPPTSTVFAPNLPVLTPTCPTLTPASSAPSGTITPTGYGPSTFGTPSKRLSPTHGSLTPGGAAYGSSPMTEGFAHVSGVHTPVSHSPSIYLQHRASPYKPIRTFNTLLYPPPSASLHEYHLSGSVVPPTQMHYQPLGRRNEFRTGIVPEFQLNPFGGAVRQGLPLTPIHTMGQPQNLHTPYHN